MPFCSERCRLLDLGNWASGKYVISTPARENEFEAERRRAARKITRKTMTSDGAGKRRSPAWMVATALGAGYAPKAPGTAGSLVALLIVVPLAALGANNLWFLLISLGALYPAIVASGIVAGQSGVKFVHSRHRRGGGPMADFAGALE